MKRWTYVNGRYVRHRDARVSVEDRAFQFADGVYEVCEVRGAALIDEARHIDRLERSLGELRIAWPVTRAALGVIMREIIRRNRVRDGMVYLEISRGTAPRDHAFPSPGVRPTLVVSAHEIDPAKGDARALEGIAVITLPDQRWKRPDIKSVSLLANVLAKQAAKDAGAQEAFLYDAEGFITEGSATNAWIVTADRKVVTRPADGAILRGVTRTTLVEVLARHGLELEERPFHKIEIAEALEAFTTGATTIVMPVVSCDGRKVGTGRPGPVATLLRTTFHESAISSSLMTLPNRTGAPICRTV